MDIENLSFGQKIEDGLVLPWFTHGSLEEIKSMDLLGKNILMFGSGKGDVWLARRCKKLVVIERDNLWLTMAYQNVEANKQTNLEYVYRPCNDCSGMDKYYLDIPEGFKPDVVIVDDAYRYEAIIMALALPRPLTLIVDNWQQDYVFISPSAEKAVDGFDRSLHIQPDHKDHEGRPWQTAIFYLK